MADVNKSFQLKVLADLRDFQKELAKIPGYTDKSAAAAALKLEQQFLKSAQTVGKHGHEAGGKIASALETAHHSARKLGGALSVIDPQLGGLVREVGHLAAGLGLAGAGGETLLITLGSVAIGALGIAEAYHHVREEIEEAYKKAEESSKEALEAQFGEVDAHRYINEAKKKLDEKFALEEKAITAETFHNYIQFAEDTVDVFLESVKAVSDVVARVTHIDYFHELSDALDTVQVNIDELADSYDVGTIEDQTKALDGQIESLLELARAVDEKKDADKEAKKAAEEHARILELVAEREESVAEYEDAQRLKETAAAAQEVADARKAEIEWLDELVRKNGTLKEQMEAHAVVAASTRDAWLDAFGSINNAMGQTFNNSKEAAIATAFVNIALGATKTIADLGFPTAIPFLIAEGAAGAAEIAQISKQSYSPTFHSGGIVGYNRGDGNVSVTAQTGEAYLNRTATSRLGRRGVEELNRGGGMGGAIFVPQIYDHRTMNTWAVRSLGSLGSPHRVAVQKAQTGVRPGRRPRL